MAITKVVRYSCTGMEVDVPLELIGCIISGCLRRGLLAPMLAVFLYVPPSMAVAQSVVETFGHGSAGWTSSDGAASLQNRGGVLCVVDKSSGWLTLHASSRFYGLWGASGGKLSFRVKADPGPIKHDLIVTISGPGGSATHSIPASHLIAGAWVPISIGLEAAAWKVQGDWSKLTQNVTAFSIRIDLWDNHNSEEVNCIENVRLLRGSVDPLPTDVWLGKWSGASSYKETTQVWDWWFEVSRSCGKYEIQTHTSGPDMVEILKINVKELEFLFHDELGTHIKISRLKNENYSGTVTQPNNAGLPRGRVDGRKTGEASAPAEPELERVEIVELGSLKAVDEIGIGQKFAVKLTYTKKPCRKISETITVRTRDGIAQKVHVSGKGRVIVSKPISVTQAK